MAYWRPCQKKMVYDCLKILAIDTGELQPDAIGMGEI